MVMRREGPLGLSIIENLQQAGDRPHVSTAKFAKEYGPLISLCLSKQILVVASFTKGSYRNS
ncbi:hypothetical protein OSB04_017292 [Centaurea solstitialis]|uniref:Uncharacterized protein n=1 Tax=Centaurea solstitialis TaxID=347529 RepID=A0AA38WAK1_9ASTR|nr:hypothetical protein OSB04_017292 [Centaurea solstitialis]